MWCIRGEGGKQYKYYINIPVGIDPIIISFSVFCFLFFFLLSFILFFFRYLFCIELVGMNTVFKHQFDESHSSYLWSISTVIFKSEIGRIRQSDWWHSTCIIVEKEKKNYFLIECEMADELLVNLINMKKKINGKKNWWWKNSIKYLKWVDRRKQFFKRLISFPAIILLYCGQETVLSIFEMRFKK